MARLQWALALMSAVALTTQAARAQEASGASPKVAADAPAPADMTPNAGGVATPEAPAGQETAPAAGETAPTRWLPGLRWGLSAGYSRYAEDTMELAGPTVGLLAEWQQPLGLAHWTLQAQAQASDPNYSSPVSGSIDHRKTRELTWRALYGWPEGATWGLAGRLQAGLELQTYYNDMRGLTSAGHAGYERERYGLWATAAYQAPVAQAEVFGAQSWRLEAGLLLQGVAVSHLSQVSSSYADAYNRQNRGFSLRAERSYRYALGEFTPYLGVTRVEDSELQRYATYSVLEPANTTWQLGLKWFWH